MGDGKGLCFSPEFLPLSCLVSQAGELIPPIALAGAFFFFFFPSQAAFPADEEAAPAAGTPGSPGETPPHCHGAGGLGAHCTASPQPWQAGREGDTVPIGEL